MSRPTRPATSASLRERLRTQLADLKMPGALEALDDILRRCDSGQVSPGDAIEQLLGAHIQLRNARRLQTAMRSARLPAVKTLADFDFSFQPSVKREQLESLHTLGFIERKENVVLLGPPGVGKRISPSAWPSPRPSTAAASTSRRSPICSTRSRKRRPGDGSRHGSAVAGDRRCSITAAAIGPGRRPRQLSPDESRRMNLNDDVVYRCRRLGPLRQLHPGSSRSLVRHHDRLHPELSPQSFWRRDTLVRARKRAIGASAGADRGARSSPSADRRDSWATRTRANPPQWRAWTSEPPQYRSRRLGYVDAKKPRMKIVLSRPAAQLTVCD